MITINFPDFQALQKALGDSFSVSDGEGPNSFTDDESNQPVNVVVITFPSRIDITGTLEARWKAVLFEDGRYAIQLWPEHSDETIPIPFENGGTFPETIAELVSIHGPFARIRTKNIEGAFERLVAELQVGAESNNDSGGI